VRLQSSNYLWDVEGVEDGDHVGGEASSCSGGWSESPYPRQSGATARYPAAATARIWWRHEYHISGASRAGTPPSPACLQMNEDTENKS
jgi:hypothetical protein